MMLYVMLYVPTNVPIFKPLYGSAENMRRGYIAMGVAFVVHPYETGFRFQLRSDPRPIRFVVSSSGIQYLILKQLSPRDLFIWS